MVFAGKLGNWNKTVESCPPGSEDKGEDGCGGIVIPTKLITVDGKTHYCCSKESSST